MKSQKIEFVIEHKFCVLHVDVHYSNVPECHPLFIRKRLATAGNMWSIALTPTTTASCQREPANCLRYLTNPSWTRARNPRPLPNLLKCSNNLSVKKRSKTIGEDQLRSN